MQTKWEGFTIYSSMLIGVVVMACLMYVFYGISQTCGYPLIDGKCQKVKAEQTITEPSNVQQK